MRSIRFVAVILAVLVAFTSCSRDPNVVKKRYLESGNKYFDRGRYKEASIQSRNALKRDQKYGAAHYKLALVSLKVGDVAGAVPSLRRAVELLPPDQAIIGKPWSGYAKSIFSRAQARSSTWTTWRSLPRSC
jgi:Tfp pilus assembly protein PilF